MVGRGIGIRQGTWLSLTGDGRIRQGDGRTVGGRGRVRQGNGEGTVEHLGEFGRAMGEFARAMGEFSKARGGEGRASKRGMGWGVGNGATW